MVILFLKQVVTWTGNLKETGDIENKLDKTSEWCSQRFHKNNSIGSA